MQNKYDMVPFKTIPYRQGESMLRKILFAGTGAFPDGRHGVFRDRLRIKILKETHPGRFPREPGSA
jgi:hypothetical protein